MAEQPYRWYQEAHEIARTGGTSEEIARYFEARTRRLKIVHTTRTPSGQILDWIPVQSQHPGGQIASPPPNGRQASSLVAKSLAAPGMTSPMSDTPGAAKNAPPGVGNDR